MCSCRGSMESRLVSIILRSHFGSFSTRAITMSVLHLGSLENNNHSSFEYEICSTVTVIVRDYFSDTQNPSF